MSKLLAVLCSFLPEIGDDWEKLAKRAHANVFMSPAAVTAAQATGFSDVKVLQAWTDSGEGRELAAVWAMRTSKLSPAGPSILTAPAYDYAFVSNPVVDPQHMDGAVGAMLDAVAADPALPKVIRLKFLDGDAQTFGAIERALAARGCPALKLAEHERPFVTRTSGVKNSGSTRKKLRQDWNRLAGLGAVEIVNYREAAAGLAAFEDFLVLEAASWKGRNGTALLSSDTDAAFARRLIGDLAAKSEASVALLRVDGRPIAAQVLLYSGTMAYTWKTAFDAEYAKFSPGALLVDKITEQLFSSGEVEAIESCSPEGSFMAQLWSGRRKTVDLLIDVGSRRSASFVAVAVWERGYARVRALRDELRSVAWLPNARRKGLAVSRA